MEKKLSEFHFYVDIFLFLENLLLVFSLRIQREEGCLLKKYLR